MPPGPYDLEPTVPSGAESRRLGSQRIRELKTRLEATFKDGPMWQFPTNVECTPGWSRVLPPYPSEAALFAVAVLPPYYRLATVSPDGGATISSLFIELPTGWRRISGRP
jgi:hypothetical protein